MVASVYWQWEFLIQTIKLGIKIAFIYDGFLMFRLIIPHKKFLCSLEDLIYWVYAILMMFQFLLEQNDGVLRGYAVAGITIGMVMYHKLLGDRIIAGAQKWIGMIKTRLTSVIKMLRIKLCKHKHVSIKNRREDGRKKNSGKKKKTESFGNDTCTNGSTHIDAGSGCE